MNTRALLVVGAVFALPAWSQEQPLDLSVETIRKIAHDTAATQYAVPPLTEPNPAEPRSAVPKAEKVVRYVPPEKPPAKQVAKLNLPPMPAAVDESFFSFLVDTLIEEALNLEPDDPVETNTVTWLSCQSAIDLKRETLGQKSCKE